MLPLKWKIFRILNYLQLVMTLGMLGIIFFLAIERFERINLKFSIYSCVMLLIIITDNFLNLFTLQNRSAEKAVANFKKRTHQLIFVLYIIIAILFLVAGVISISEQISSDYTYPKEATMFSIVFLLIAFLTIPIVLFQAGLYGFLRQNHNLYMQQLVEEIGQPDSA